MRPLHRSTMLLPAVGVLALLSSSTADAGALLQPMPPLIGDGVTPTTLQIVGVAPGAKVKVKEGQRERLQAFEGVCIAKRNRGLNSSFTVRKMSHGEGVERVFQLHSPLLHSIKVKRRGDVRRAKLYYLRGRTGHAAPKRNQLLLKRIQLV